MTKRKANPQKAGRKTKYKPEFDKMAYKYALLNLTDVQMASLFEVPEKTFNGWKKRYPAFRVSIIEGKDLADAEVAHSLVERAKGFTWTEEVPTKVKEVKYKDGKRLSEVEHVIITKVERTVPPDTRAIQYWMNNRRRRKTVDPEADPVEAATEQNTWADRHEIDHTTKGDKIPAPQVYLPADYAEDIMGDAPTEDVTP
jgi:hypothetical protein